MNSKQQEGVGGDDLQFRAQRVQVMELFVCSDVCSGEYSVKSGKEGDSCEKGEIGECTPECCDKTQNEEDRVEDEQENEEADVVEGDREEGNVVEGT